MAITTTLLSDVRRTGQLAQNVTDAEILATADIELKATIYPFLRRMNSNFGVREVQLTPSNGRCPLPRRAIGASVRCVQVQVGASWVNLPQLQLEQDVGNTTATGLPVGFYVDSGDIVLVPRGSSATLRVMYWPQPGRLVAVANCALISSVNSSYSATLTRLGSNTAISPAVSYIDIISGASHHSMVLMNSSVTQSTSTYDVLTANFLWGPAVGSTPVVGDYICEQNTSCVVPIPDDLYPVLVYQVASVHQRALGYVNEAEATSREAQRRLEAAVDTVAPRIQGNPPRLTGGVLRAIGGTGYNTGWRF